MNVIRLSIFLLISSAVYSQRDTLPPFFNEFGIAPNITNNKQGSFAHHLGFGLSAYRTVMKEKTINLFFGLEYNLTRNFFDRIDEGKYTHSTNVKLTEHNISMPFGMRFNLGKLFLETGVFADMPLLSKKSGTKHTYYTYTSSTGSPNKEYSFESKVSGFGLGFGFSAGLGVKIPLNQFKLIIKPDYKIGLRSFHLDNTFWINYFRLVLAMQIP